MPKQLVIQLAAVFIFAIRASLLAQNVELDIPKNLDFGVIETNQGRGILRRELPVKNTSSQTVVLSAIVSGCSCVTIRERFPLTILPGATARIGLEMLLTAADFGGREVAIIVQSDPERTPIAVVKLKGKSALSPYIIPGAVDFGRLEQGKTKTKRFRVFVPANQASGLAIKDVMALRGSPFSARIVSQVLEQTQTGMALLVATIDLYYDGSRLVPPGNHETMKIPIAGSTGIDVSVVWN